MGNNKEIQRQQYNRTVTMLKQYRDAQFFIQHTTDEESRQRTEAAVQHITAALEEIQRRRQQAEREEEYTALRMYYMQGYTYEQIEKELNTGKDTPRRWITAAVKELAVNESSNHIQHRGIYGNAVYKNNGKWWHYAVYQ